LIVADTNLIAYLLLPGDHTRSSERVYERDSHWIAPLLWRSELRNVLALYLQRREMTLEVAVELVDLGEALMRGNEYAIASQEVLGLAAESRCSAYDCEFVALARQNEIPLVTTDQELLATFPKVAIAPESFAV
jgi:predicted nucleic acid-binding protein